MVSVDVSHHERERERETDRQTDRQTETDRQTDRQRGGGGVTSELRSCVTREVGLSSHSQSHSSRPSLISPMVSVDVSHHEKKKKMKKKKK